MIRYLTIEQFLYFAGQAVGGAVAVRDVGLVESALHRPQATAFGQDAYPDIWTKAAALFQSLATNHALVDGNKRTALAATYAFLQLNGHRLTMSNDDAVDLALAVATGQLAEVEKIAEALRSGAE
ncbi:MULTISPECIES: type II toxin-antitoxin system death-on-curing family toxin [Pseudonocardia]|uniref:Toxin Doc n=2 Tax=Pseudonocardia TaxID=1847 RepID=A0A1Y2MPY0_PSEAH|nr:MULTISPECIES: type II toxin-antitoxin system death-on-curing family toxin [Pseudonocardia]OSY37280.1 Toxin Doc [Pseudonocardia autotrophica]TDN72423.1 death-on-curing protein [Pseudonocardia autotrophica]BBG03132.1 toxin Doc [Pseudonocardia autotrophica]GEC23751.1 toxin Doc [Pseudonocardia saturnea]